MVNRPVIGAHYGTRDWLMQRVSALLMVCYVLFLLGLAVFHPHLDYETWQALFANEAFKLLTFLFLISLFLHAWVGMRDIYMDYLKPTGLRLAFEVLTIAALVAYTGWAIHILWGVLK